MKTGIICGTFDLLHAGHIMTLTEAKKNCDYLIVALRTSGSRRCPRKHQPVQSLVERFIQLEGTPYVDEIIPYESEEDLMDVVQTFLPHMLFIAEECQEIDMDCEQFCSDVGVEVYQIRKQHRFSTEMLRSTVAEREATKHSVLNVSGPVN